MSSSGFVPAPDAKREPNEYWVLLSAPPGAVIDLRQHDRLLRAAERVAGVRGAEFDDGADVARVKFFHRRAVAAVEQVELAEALGDLPRAVEHFLARVDVAREEPEQRELAEAGLVHRLEHKSNWLGLRERHRASETCGIPRGNFRAVHR